VTQTCLELHCNIVFKNTFSAVEMAESTAKSFEMIDGIVLPIAVVILGIQLRSYRHMGIALVNLIGTILLAFAILLPITKTVAINPFAPSIMMSLGIAISFDYTLFMLTRFQEEVGCS
jgi:uncharacterized membrane protein YdfJ with MMPL/SSD domain